jgi:hypothetical protein
MPEASGWWRCPVRRQVLRLERLWRKRAARERAMPHSDVHDDEAQHTDASAVTERVHDDGGRSDGSSARTRVRLAVAAWHHYAYSAARPHPRMRAGRRRPGRGSTLTRRRRRPRACCRPTYHASPPNARLNMLANRAAARKLPTAAHRYHPHAQA